MGEFLLFLSVLLGFGTNKQTVLYVTGDVMPGRMVNVRLQELGDFDYPFKNNLFSEADIVFINLESPVIENCPKRYDGFKFCSDPRIVPALKKAGVDIVNIANNHIYNEGKSGKEFTSNILRKNNIQVTGFGEAVIIGDLGFLGYNDVGETVDTFKLEEEIKSLKNDVKFVIVQFHWGVEYTSKPSKRQKELAHTAIDAGAELVVGNHTHWVQETEMYKGKLIAYSHGNFIFDQQWSQETQEGVIGKYVFDQTGLIDHEFMPIIIDKTYQPRWANDEEAKRIRVRMGI